MEYWDRGLLQYSITPSGFNLSLRITITRMGKPIEKEYFQ